MVSGKGGWKKFWRREKGFGWDGVQSDMTVTKFENLTAWQKSQDLAVDIYKHFQKLNDFGFKDQICKASLSISNNIAEGFDRRTKVDMKRFLVMARGSCYEVKSMVYLSDDLGYLDSNSASQLLRSCEEVSRIITGFIKSLN